MSAQLVTLEGHSELAGTLARTVAGYIPDSVRAYLPEDCYLTDIAGSIDLPDGTLAGDDEFFYFQPESITVYSPTLSGSYPLGFKIKMKMPKIKFPKIKFPKIKFPKIKMPKLNFKMPKLNFKLPKIKLPDFGKGLKNIGKSFESGFKSIGKFAEHNWEQLGTGLSTVGSAAGGLLSTVGSMIPGQAGAMMQDAGAGIDDLGQYGSDMSAMGNDYTQDFIQDTQGFIDPYIQDAQSIADIINPYIPKTNPFTPPYVPPGTVDPTPGPGPNPVNPSVNIPAGWVRVNSYEDLSPTTNDYIDRKNLLTKDPEYDGFVQFGNFLYIRENTAHLQASRAAGVYKIRITYDGQKMESNDNQKMMMYAGAGLLAVFLLTQKKGGRRR